MAAPWVIMKRSWDAYCSEYASHDDIEKSFEPGETYSQAQAEADNNAACCDGVYWITSISWDPNYGSFGRMAIVVATDCCEPPQCRFACDMQTNNYFYLSPDGSTFVGHSHSNEILGAGTYYIVAAEHDLPPAFARPKVGGSLAGGRKGLA